MEELKSVETQNFKISNKILNLVHQNEVLLQLLYNVNISQFAFLIKKCNRSQLELLAELVHKINNNTTIEFLEQSGTQEDTLIKLKKALLENEVFFKNFEPSKPRKRVNKVGDQGSYYLVKNYRPEKSDGQMMKLASDNCETLQLVVQCLFPVCLEMARGRIREREEKANKPKEVNEEEVEMSSEMSSEHTLSTPSNENNLLDSF